MTSKPKRIAPLMLLLSVTLWAAAQGGDPPRLIYFQTQKDYLAATAEPSTAADRSGVRAERYLAREHAGVAGGDVRTDL